MFIVTARVPKKRLVAAAIGLLCCCALVAVWAAGAGERGPLRDNGGRVAYLESLGWTVEEEPLLEETLLIPETFDESYDEYLALQTSQGFDLTPYCGEQVVRYTYVILNHPSGEDGIQAALLVHDGTLIGGEVLSPAAGGFLHGLSVPTG